MSNHLPRPLVPQSRPTTSGVTTHIHDVYTSRVHHASSTGHPPNRLSAGTTKTWNVTSADAGFPGRANRNLRSSPAFPLRFLSDHGAAGMLANVVGFPGFIATRPKWIVPSNRRSTTGLMRSLAPIDVPPVVRSKSAFCSPLEMAWTCALTLGIIK